jgi:hypothetical protein
VLSADASLIEQVLQLTAGVGVDVAVEAVGRNETVGAAIESVRKGGTVVLVGNISHEVTLPLQKVVTRQIRLQGSCASAGEYPQAMELLATRAIQVKPLITAIAPMDDGPQWFERLHAREPNLMKLFLPGVFVSDGLFDLGGRVAMVTGTSRGLVSILLVRLQELGRISCSPAAYRNRLLPFEEEMQGLGRRTLLNLMSANQSIERLRGSAEKKLC